MIRLLASLLNSIETETINPERDQRMRQQRKESFSD